MRITITNKITGDVVTLSRFVIDDKYPQWVYEQTKCRNGRELVNLLNSLDANDYYNEKGEHTGPDSLGLALYDEEIETSKEPCINKIVSLPLPPEEETGGWGGAGMGKSPGDAEEGNRI